MASRGSAITRAVKYFRECDLDEARVAFQLVKEVVEGRLKAEAPKAATVRKARKPRERMLISSDPRTGIARESLGDA